MSSLEIDCNAKCDDKKAGIAIAKGMRLLGRTTKSDRRARRTV